MLTLAALIAGAGLAAAPSPIVAVLDLPTPLTPEESAPLPAVPTDPTLPQQPEAGTGDESAWEAYREAQVAYAAAQEQTRAMAAARRDAERAARDGARARGRLDRSAASLAYSVEYALGRLRVFDVRTARQVRAEAVELLDGLRECVDAQCLSGVAAVTGAGYIVTMRPEVGEPEIRVTLIEIERPTGAAVAAVGAAPFTMKVLGQEGVAVGGSARDIIPQLFVRAMANELDDCYRYAQVSADGLGWPDALDWLGRCLAIDSNHGPSLFLAGRAFFEFGDLRSAEKRLRQAILQEVEVGESSHLLALVNLRKRRESTAAGYFEAAIAAGRDSFTARLLLGRLAINRDADVAIGHLERAVSMRPNHGETSFLLGSLLRTKGEKKRARAFLEIAVAADHKAGDAHFELGGLAAEAADLKWAVSHYEAARDRGRTTTDVLMLLGRHYVKNDPARAVITLSEARRKGARADDLDFNLGRAALAAGETNVGISALKRALSVEAHAPDARVLLGQTYANLGNLPMAAYHYGPAIHMGRDSYQARIAIADATVERGEKPLALEHFVAALRHRPGDGRASYGAALVLIERKQIKDAVPHLERSLAAAHRLAETRAHLGRAALHLKDRESALTHFKAAAAAGSHEADVFRFLAMASNRGGNLDGAVAMWDRVLELVPGDAEASFRLGRLRIQQGRAEAARPLLEHAAKANVFRGRAHRLLAGLARDRRDAARALFHYEEAVKIIKADFELFANTGWAALDAGRDDRARHYLTRALAFRPGDGKLSFALGDIDLRGRRFPEARAFFRNALAADHRVSDCLYRLGDVAGLLGDAAEQKKQYLAALAAGAKDATLFVAMAEIVAKEGATAEAVRYYTAGARAAMQEANQEVAKLALERGLTLAPDGVELNRIARQLAASTP